MPEMDEIHKNILVVLTEIREKQKHGAAIAELSRQNLLQSHEELKRTLLGNGQPGEISKIHTRIDVVDKKVEDKFGKVNDQVHNILIRMAYVGGAAAAVWGIIKAPAILEWLL